MTSLETPDLCAHLDRLRTLCDRLEATQKDPAEYRQLVERIEIEVNALRNIVCRIERDETS